MPFTDKQVAALRPKAQRYEKPEPGRTGLSIRVTPNGVKTWALRYRLDGANRRIVLGTYPKMGVAAAHGALADAREKLSKGIDPGALIAAAHEVERNAETVKQLGDEYLERHARKKKKASSAAEDERLLNVEVLPVWGKRKAKDITRRDVIRLLDAIEDRGSPVTRNRAAALLSRLFRFGMDRGIVDASPAVGIERLPETPRERTLSAEEVAALWHGLDDAEMTAVAKIALRFALVTGQRRGEVAGITRDEINDAEKLWSLPGSRTKNGRDNVVPLPPLAMRLVAEADKLRVKPLPTRPKRKDRRPHDPEPSPWLFPSRIGKKPVEPEALTRALNRNRDTLGEGWRLHDLRRTFATEHGELGTPPEILGALLNHSPQTVTERVYNRAQNIEARRSAMERWCLWLEKVIARDFDAAKKMHGADVIAMDRARAVA